MWTEGWTCPQCHRSLVYRSGVPCLAPELIGDSTSYNPSLFHHLMAYEEKSFWFVCRAWLINRLISRYFPSALNLMEVGCGTGSVLKAIQEASPLLRLFGSELHPEGLSFAKQRLGGRAHLVQMDARRICARAEFDIIGAFDVIEHIVEDLDVLAQMRSAVRPFGGIILTVPQHTWLWSPVDELAHHQRRYNRGELEGRVAQAGFRVLCSTSFNSLLLPLMLLSRRKISSQAKSGLTTNPLAEFNMPSWVNAVLKTALMSEVYMTSFGLRWPVGGSRVVVAVAR